jgi:transposase
MTDDRWERITDILHGQSGSKGVMAKDNRLFINAVFWIAKTGAPWRDLPERFGPWGRSGSGSTAGPRRGSGNGVSRRTLVRSRRARWDDLVPFSISELVTVLVASQVS